MRHCSQASTLHATQYGGAKPRLYNETVIGNTWEFDPFSNIDLFRGDLVCFATRLSSVKCGRFSTLETLSCKRDFSLQVEMKYLQFNIIHQNN